MADVKMPQLGESVTEGTIGKWLKQPGDAVVKYEPIAEVITDKVNAEIPSDFDGTLEEILVKEGETVSVGTVVCRIQAEGGAAATPAADSKASPEPTVTRDEHPVPAKPATSNRPAGRLSPAVLRLAEENNVDLNRVTGTGEGGRITRKDVLRFVEQGDVPTDVESKPQGQVQSEPKAQAPVSAPAPAKPPVGAPAGSADAEIVEPSPIRKTIARRMVESKHTAPHAWTMVEVDVTSLVAFRERTKNDFKRKEGVSLTYMPFFLKAVAEALKEYPMLNAAWVDDQIHMHKDINVSIAVATDDSLVVPVIHHADRLSIAGLAHAIQDVAVRARSNRLRMEDVQGGTFTLNNTGAFGSVLSQPIINMPQAAILSVESIVKRPVVIDDMIAIRSMVNLCLSLDHRLLDGWIAGQFLAAVKNRMQSYNTDTILY